MIAKQFLALSLVIVASVALQLEKSARDHLVHDLLDNYHESVEPSGRIELTFGLSLLCARFDPIKSKLTTNAFEKYTWSDYRLSWDPKDYDGIEKLRLPANLIWKPDINCYSAIEAEEKTRENVLIDHDGTVWWVPRTVFKTLCNVVDKKPVCDLRFGWWPYDQYTLALETEGDGVSVTSYMNETCSWNVDNFAVHTKTSIYPCCKEPYVILGITLNLSPNADDHPEPAPAK